MACAATQGPVPGNVLLSSSQKFLLSLEQEALHFYFAPGLVHYVANPVTVNVTFFLFKIIADVSKKYHVLGRKQNSAKYTLFKKTEKYTVAFRNILPNMM